MPLKLGDQNRSGIHPLPLAAAQDDRDSPGNHSQTPKNIDQPYPRLGLNSAPQNLRLLLELLHKGQGHT
jgi:hypothetical protein